MVHPAVKLVVSAREYDILRDFIQSNIDDNYYAKSRKSSARITPTEPDNDQNAAAFRAATRVYLGTTFSLKSAEALLNRIRVRRNRGLPTTTSAGTAAIQATAKGGLGIARNRLALSLASLLFFHRVLYRLFSRLRLQLLHEKVKNIKKRYPAIYATLTSVYAPAVGASLSGLALGIYPVSQLRITIGLYALVRAFEMVYASARAAGYLKNKPRWVGSWMFFALANGQLLHAFVFDRDCFPGPYQSLIMNNTHEYIQRRPADMSEHIAWPKKEDLVDALAEMARLRWPPFVSPILHPQRAKTLPPSIDPVISSVTSRAHPAIQHLSCALLHPSDVSCFTPFLRQILMSFSSASRFFAMYYGALSVLKIRKLFATPGPFANHLAKQILKTALAMCGAISTSWASICLFNNILPKKLFPQFRFFIGGVLGGSFAIVDQGTAGHINSMYALRSTLDSLWKVGKKHGWWKGVKGGSVILFVASLMALNVVFDLHSHKDSSMKLVKILRGETEFGLKDDVESKDTKSS